MVAVPSFGSKESALYSIEEQDFIELEKAWLDDRGLQDRPWSRSLYVSPDPFSGYASWMLPGLRYEIETDDPDDVPDWEERYIAAIRRLAGSMDRTTTLIRESM